MPSTNVTPENENRPSARPWYFSPGGSDGTVLASRCTAFTALDSDLRLVQPCASTCRTLARLRQFLFIEGKSAGAAAGGDDDDVMACRFRGAKSVKQVLLNIAAFEPEIPREGRHRPWLDGQQGQQVFTKGHLNVRRVYSSLRIRARAVPDQPTAAPVLSGRTVGVGYLLKLGGRDGAIHNA